MEEFANKIYNTLAQLLADQKGLEVVNVTITNEEKTCLKKSTQFVA